MTRIILTATVLAATSALAHAQSATASGTTKPIDSASPSGSTKPIGQIREPLVKMPPAARSGESGLRYGQGAATGDPIDVKRIK
jgi:hypothetical protein